MFNLTAAHGCIVAYVFDNSVLIIAQVCLGSLGHGSSFTHPKIATVVQQLAVRAASPPGTWQAVTLCYSAPSSWATHSRCSAH